jgi:hypothetical protein
MNRKLILLEMNEIPFRVLDLYRETRPKSALARLMANSRQFETFTEDRLALDPWISWPTFHRGVNDEKHGILHLGQVLDDVDSQFPPIWKILQSHGRSVGIFGSLHSSCVPANAKNYAFYLPDYFDERVFAHPASLEPFQELNLAMTRQSARNVSRRIPLSSFARFLRGAMGTGLTAGTIGDSALHLAREVVQPGLRIRRRAYQPLIMLDLFIRQLERTQPDFATFYTNHVAAAMHRYWGATFAEDYERRLDAEWIATYRGEIVFAMEKLDRMVSKLKAFVDRHPEYTLVAASSMGQAAIPAEKTFEFLTITDLARFMSALGVAPDQWQARPAMVPCVCAVIADASRARVVDGLTSMSIGGRNVRRDKRPRGPASFDEREEGFFQFFVQFDNYAGPDEVTINSRRMALSEAGLGMMAHEDGVNCTAQHVPEGSLLVYRADHLDGGRRADTRISTLEVAPAICDLFGVPRPAYMDRQELTL